jgi:hypothetical protein
MLPEGMALKNECLTALGGRSALVAIILAAASFISPHRPTSVPQALHRAVESSVGLAGTRHRWLHTLGTRSSRPHRRYPFFKSPLVGRLRIGQATDRPRRAGARRRGRAPGSALGASSPAPTFSKTLGDDLDRGRCGLCHVAITSIH